MLSCKTKARRDTLKTMKPEHDIPFEKYFVAAKAVVLDEEGRMLTLLRGQTAPANPLHWDLPGGIVEYGEDLETCVVRETQEEAAIAIDSLRVFHAVARMNSIGEFWTTIFYAARAASLDVRISWEHDEFRWIVPEEFLDLKISARQREAVQLLLARKPDGKI